MFKCTPSPPPSLTSFYYIFLPLPCDLHHRDKCSKHVIAVNGVCIVLSSAAMLSYAKLSSALLLPAALLLFSFHCNSSTLLTHI